MILRDNYLEKIKVFINKPLKNITFSFEEKTMCQMKVMLDKEGRQELVMEDVTKLEVTEDGIRVSTFFEEPKTVPGVAVKMIDFISGTVTLQSKPV